MPTILERIAYKKHRFTPGDTAFVLFGLANFVAGICLLLLPARRVTNASLIVIYSLLPPRLWSLLFLIAAFVPLLAVLHPTIATRKAVYCVLLPMGVAWTSGLFISFFTRETTNFWAPLIWLLITCLGYTSYALIPLDAPFYRKLRKDTIFHRINMRRLARYGRKDEHQGLVGSHRIGK